jgi:hypothetical protein
LKENIHSATTRPTRIPSIGKPGILTVALVVSEEIEGADDAITAVADVGPTLVLVSVVTVVVVRVLVIVIV